MSAFQGAFSSDGKKRNSLQKNLIFAGLILAGFSLQFGQRASALPLTITMATACRHPKVRIVSRHEDSEFVECLECGEVFDAEEFRDMEIEDTAQPLLDDEES